MAWAKTGSVTGSGSSIDITDSTPSKHNQIMGHVFLSGDLDLRMRLGNGSFDTTASYSDRLAHNYGSYGAQTGETDLHIMNTSSGNDSLFFVMYMINISDREKLDIFFANLSAGSGLSSIQSMTGVNKWDETGGQFDYIQIKDETGSEIDTDSNLTVIGSDLTPVAAVPFPTNVQTGSRFEETDTRKIYHWVLGGTETTATYQNDNGDAEAGLDNTYTIEALKITSSSNLVGKRVSKFSMWLKQKQGSPTGTATLGVFDSSGTTLFTFGTLDVSADLTTSFQEISKENTSSYTLSANEYVGVKWTNGSTSNKITPQLDTGNNYDGTNTFRSRFSGSWSNSTTIDQRFRLYLYSDDAWTEET